MTSDNARRHRAYCVALLLFACWASPTAAQQPAPATSTTGATSPTPTTTVLFNDVHFHLTNYIQEGLAVEDFLVRVMGSKVGRVALFGIPLQQTWSYENSGEQAPTYYLDSDAPLYYYSFTDAYIAMAYRALSQEQQQRFDPMITGFNPADMYAADHIRRVLKTFPGVFSGIGELTIHKEFVSSKVAGDTASLTDPALDRLLDLAAEVGLVVLIHSDIDVPFAKVDAEPVYLAQMKALLARHRNHIQIMEGISPIENSPTSISTSRGVRSQSTTCGRGRPPT